MIIYWRIGNDCNLNCKYCRIIGVNKHSPKKIQFQDHNFINDIVMFTRKIVANNGADPTTLVLYGGEPLLYQESIMQFLEKTRDLQIESILHTNGTLLNEIDGELLKDIDKILVSIDGNKTITDKYRGDGTYNKIREGVESIRKIYNGEIIARSTLTLDASIKDSILDLNEWFDGMFWQIENSPLFDDSAMNSFLLRYDEDLKYLVKFWMDSLQKGHVINILPFQAIASTLLLNKKEDILRCGCGSKLIVIDGKECFTCDELEGISDDVYLGTIYENVTPKSEAIISKVKKVCKDCPIFYVCGGRCFNSLSFFPPEKFKFYCKATFLLVDNIKPKVPELISLVNGKVDIHKIMHPVLNVIDQIP